MKTATLLKVLPRSAPVYAELYELSEPMIPYAWRDEPAPEPVYFVVVSASAVFGEPETYIFPADPDGEITSWLELPDSQKGIYDTVKVLEEAGYTVNK